MASLPLFIAQQEQRNPYKQVCVSTEISFQLDSKRLTMTVESFGSNSSKVEHQSVSRH